MQWVGKRRTPLGDYAAGRVFDLTTGLLLMMLLPEQAIARRRRSSPWPG